jgi:hypothetical protein
MKNPIPRGVHFAQQSLLHRKQLAVFLFQGENTVIFKAGKNLIKNLDFRAANR